jgi:hypothetical protein
MADQKFIIKSGAGYFVKFIRAFSPIPNITSDQALARQFDSEADAQLVLDELESWGWSGEVVPVISAEMSGHKEVDL